MSRGQYNQHDFSIAPQADIPRSSFDRSFGYKTTINADYLYPVFIDEVVPGDTMDLGADVLIRMATPINPPMDTIYYNMEWFYTPDRLVMDKWVNLMGEQTNPNDSIDYTVPVLSPLTGSAIYDTGSIHDYFGIPTKTTGLSNINALPFRAYNLIYNEWYRNENLIDSLTVDKGLGPDTTSYVLQKSAKVHDYFSSALPWAQKGAASTVSLGGSAPVKGIGAREQGFPVSGQVVYESGATSSSTFANSQLINHTENASCYYVKGTAASGYPDIYADLSSATPIDINTLRQAFQIQKFLERDARGGTRYIETIRSHFNVISPDQRMQRPEYLGACSGTIGIHSVPQNSSTDSTSPQGNLAAFGIGTSSKHAFSKSFTEHGYIIGLLRLRGDLTYQQGLNRMWSRRTRYDFYWPVFAHLGEQTILNKEIYAQGTSADDDPFGYQERYAEMRYYPSMVTGKFRSNATGTLDSWHLSQDFSSLPTLGQTFNDSNTPMTRIQAVNTEPSFLVDIHYNYRCARPMPMYSVPGLVDHF